MSIVGGRWITDGASATREHVAQIVSQLFNLVFRHITVVPEAAILRRSSGSLKITMRYD